ncbi:hypothetical protein N0V84_008100 [Fusarium piperis]|uniref:Uncharacterized protein n=1 Tax=Fusarium piperis TaxID=1435070 RepID=A0A9W8W8W4_9HYPO|nr:hypothetical protein N0V84_008100 [Fusarium piperis]
MKPNYLLPVLAAAGTNGLPLSSSLSATLPDEIAFGICFSNSECSGSTPICYEYTSTCVGCVVSSNCGGLTPICDTDTLTCVACISSDDCPGLNDLCDPIALRCVGCISNAECSGSTPVCDPDSRVCVAGVISPTKELLEDPTQEPVDETQEQPKEEPFEEPEDDTTEQLLGEPHPVLDTTSGSDISPPASDADLPPPDHPSTPDL